MDDVARDALAYAKARAEQMRNEPIEMFGQNVRFLSRDDGEAYAAHATAYEIARGGISPERAAQEARAGDRLFYNAICRLVAAELRGGVEIAGPLRALAIDMLEAPPKLKPGLKKESHFFRNLAIDIMVSDVCEKFDLKPTSSAKAGTGRSGCGVVAKALGMTYSAVEQVWKKRLDQ